MSDTPRTDHLLEALETHQFHGDAGDVVDFARDLERELAAVTAERDAAKKDADNWFRQYKAMKIGGPDDEEKIEMLETQLAAMTSARDAFKRAKAENDERFQIERDQARRERDALLEARAWRPIADGLPCFGVDVLVLSEDEYGSYQSEAQLETPSEGAPEGWINWKAGDGTATSEDAWTRGTITHWMPLPEPPKELRKHLTPASAMLDVVNPIDSVTDAVRDACGRISPIPSVTITDSNPSIVSHWLFAEHIARRLRAASSLWK